MKTYTLAFLTGGGMAMFTSCNSVAGEALIRGAIGGITAILIKDIYEFLKKSLLAWRKRK